MADLCQPQSIMCKLLVGGVVPGNVNIGIA